MKNVQAQLIKWNEMKKQMARSKDFLAKKAKVRWKTRQDTREAAGTSSNSRWKRSLKESRRLKEDCTALHLDFDLKIAFCSNWVAVRFFCKTNLKEQVVLVVVIITVV